MMFSPRQATRGACVLLCLTLAGCAGFSPDGGFATVQQTTRDRLGHEVRWARSDDDRQALQQRTSELLASPLTADSAVQVALLNHRGLQAGFAQLGIAEAEWVAASRLPNPGFSIGRLRRGDEREIERGLSFDLGHLITLPLRRGLEQRRFEAVQRQVAMSVFTLAADTRKAYFQAVAAEQAVRYQQDVSGAASASAELARRMAAAGNWSTLQHAREQAFQADAALAVARAQAEQARTRERLVRLLGLERAAFTLPDRLPDLPAQPAPQGDIEQRALDQRLDVQAARLQAEATAKNLGLSRVTRWVNVLEFGAQRNTSNVDAPQTGYEITLELPLFDWSGARVVQAEALYRQALDRAAQTGIEARSQAREAWAAMAAAHEVARRYRDEIVPLNQRIAEQNLLRYNGMLIGVFELLADARAQINSVNASIQAQRDYWLAQSDLDMALIGPPSFSPAGPAAVNAAAPAAGH